MNDKMGDNKFHYLRERQSCDRECYHVLRVKGYIIAVNDKMCVSVLPIFDGAAIPGYLRHGKK